MKIRVAIIVFVVVGAFLAAGLMIDDRTLSSGDLKKVRTVCPTCHGDVPEYPRPSQVHRQHVAFECGFCHMEQRAMKTADGLHRGLVWLFLGAMALSLTGILANLWMVDRKRRAK